MKHYPYLRPNINYVLRYFFKKVIINKYPENRDNRFLPFRLISECHVSINVTSFDYNTIISPAFTGTFWNWWRVRILLQIGEITFKMSIEWQPKRRPHTVRRLYKFKVCGVEVFILILKSKSLCKFEVWCWNLRSPS